MGENIGEEPGSAGDNSAGDAACELVENIGCLRLLQERGRGEEFGENMDDIGGSIGDGDGSAGIGEGPAGDGLPGGSAAGCGCLLRHLETLHKES